MKPLFSKVIIADKNHFVYFLFVKNVPFLSIGNKNVFGWKGAISKKQGIATVYTLYMMCERAVQHTVAGMSAPVADMCNPVACFISALAV